jgi:flagellar basal body rod protein FlgB
MNQQTIIADNITEVLTKIIEFTNTRQKILTENINNVHNFGYIPKDLPVNEFSYLMDTAVNEHIRNRRLILCDSKNITFGQDGFFAAKPVIDSFAKKLLEENKDEYIELQINKLLENGINQRLAAELLQQSQQAAESFGQSWKTQDSR